MMIVAGADAFTYRVIATAGSRLHTAPVELGVETLSLVAVELKLIAELHETYGMPAPGNGPQRMLAYVSSWAERRGVRITAGGFALAMGSPVRRKLELIRESWLQGES